MSRNLSRPVQGGLAEVGVGDEPAEDAHGEAAQLGGQLAAQPGEGVAGDEAGLQTLHHLPHHEVHTVVGFLVCNNSN